VKLLCIIFSFIVVLLSVKPCCTDSDCDAVVKTEHAGTSKAKDCTGCSPFFSCGTCAGFTISKTVTASVLINPVKTRQIYPPYQQPNIKEISLSIWQPPQIG
jgi:hypothetical protein